MIRSRLPVNLRGRNRPDGNLQPAGTARTGGTARRAVAAAAIGTALGVLTGLLLWASDLPAEDGSPTPAANPAVRRQDAIRQAGNPSSAGQTTPAPRKANQAVRRRTQLRYPQSPEVSPGGPVAPLPDQTSGHEPEKQTGVAMTGSPADLPRGHSGALLCSGAAPMVSADTDSHVCKASAVLLP